MTQAKTKAKSTLAEAPEELSCFSLDFSECPGFKYIRYFYKEERERVGIAAMFQAKLTPKGHVAARHDLLLPDAASGEYQDLPYLLQRFDTMLPRVERNGYAQFTVTLPPGQAAHVGWEQVRAWVRSYFVNRQQLAALMVLHLPFLAGSANPNHIHVLLPARRLSVHGFSGQARDVCSDQGCREALASWIELRTPPTNEESISL
jgi:hypothetical protein